MADLHPTGKFAVVKLMMDKTSIAKTKPDRSTWTADLPSSIVRARLQSRIACAVGDDFTALFLQTLDLCRAAVPVEHAQEDVGVVRAWHEAAAGRYYQVYAPAKFDELDALRQIATALEPLRLRGCEPVGSPASVNEFYFVINDAYRITPAKFPALYSALETVRRTHKLRRCRLFLAGDLEDRLMSLPYARLLSLVGTTPACNASSIRRRHSIARVVSHIAALPLCEAKQFGALAPDVRTPLSFVRLTHTRNWLEEARRDTFIVNAAMCAHLEDAGDRIRAKIEALHHRIRLRNFSDIAGGPTRDDQCLESLLREITPAAADDPAMKQTLQAAALSVIAFYALR